MSDALFLQDGKRLDNIRWPFKRYMVLMPERNEVDAFAWLYASFVKMYNLKKGNKAYEYNAEIENVVKGQIRQYFLNIIDVPTLNVVITQMEKYLDPNHPDSIKVFQNLFTDKMRIKYVFQDCITGSVVPFFYDELEVESELPRAVDFEGGLKPVKKSKPVKKYVKLAYERYLHRENYVGEEIEEIIQEYQEDEDFLKDEDNQLFEEDEDFTVKKEMSVEEVKVDTPLRKFDIKFLDDGEIIYYDVPVSIEDNMLFVGTPFDVSTSSWLNVCFVKGSKENRELKEIYDRLSVNIAPKQKIDRFFEDIKNSIYEKLPNCAELYRTIDPIGDRKLREMVWRLENYYVRRDPEFFVKCAVILERILKLVIETGGYVPSDKEFREFANKKIVHELLDAKCSHVDCYNLKKGDLFVKWKNKYVNPKDREINAYSNSNWKPRFDFKSDFLDLMIQSDISKSPLMKYETVNNIWKLWSYRNRQGHDDDNPVPIKVTPDYLEIMEESVKLLSQKIKGESQ